MNIQDVETYSSLHEEISNKAIKIASFMYKLHSSKPHSLAEKLEVNPDYHRDYSTWKVSKAHRVVIIRYEEESTSESIYTTEIAIPFEWFTDACNWEQKATEEFQKRIEEAEKKRLKREEEHRLYEHELYRKLKKKFEQEK